MNKKIILLGHRKQHGKDTVAKLLKEKIEQHGLTCSTHMFAYTLKKEVSRMYNFDMNDMEFDEFKNSKPKCLNGMSVRDYLIHYAKIKKNKDVNCFARPTYNRIFHANDDVKIITDFRYPNEYDFFDTFYEDYILRTEKNIGKYDIYKIQVLRPSGVFVNDGADDMLPDHINYWDSTIFNYEGTDWEINLKKKVDFVYNKIIM